MSIAVIVGLGNPGSEYRDSRHNIGFSIVSSLAESFGARWKTETRFEAKTAPLVHGNLKLLLVKPLTFMNNSGRPLSAILRYKKLPVSSLLVVYDDITLEFGRPKLSIDGSAGGHNGIADILSRVGSGFLRYRIGIGARPHKKIDLADYVLSKFTLDEQKILASQTPTYFEHIKLIIDKEPALAMNFINQRTAPKHERNN